jgi:hypothetical protein
MATAQRTGIYKPSEDIVARDIEGELILVPLVAGIGDAADDLFALTWSGRAIWDRLDGRTPLAQVADALTHEYDAEPGVIERDALGLVEELLDRRILVEA